jgi:hypothetical protein
MSLNVGKKMLQHLKHTTIGNELQSTYIQVYLQRPSQSKALTLIESARSYTYATSRRR